MREYKDRKTAKVQEVARVSLTELFMMTGVDILGKIKAVHARALEYA